MAKHLRLQPAPCIHPQMFFFRRLSRRPSSLSKRRSSPGAFQAKRPKRAVPRVSGEKTPPSRRWLQHRRGRFFTAQAPSSLDRRRRRLQRRPQGLLFAGPRREALPVSKCRLLLRLSRLLSTQRPAPAASRPTPLPSRQRRRLLRQASAAKASSPTLQLLIKPRRCRGPRVQQCGFPLGEEALLEGISMQTERRRCLPQRLQGSAREGQRWARPLPGPQTLQLWRPPPQLPPRCLLPHTAAAEAEALEATPPSAGLGESLAGGQ